LVRSPVLPIVAWHARLRGNDRSLGDRCCLSGESGYTFSGSQEGQVSFDGPAHRPPHRRPGAARRYCHGESEVVQGGTRRGAPLPGLTRLRTGLAPPPGARPARDREYGSCGESAAEAAPCPLQAPRGRPVPAPDRAPDGRPPAPVTLDRTGPER